RKYRAARFPKMPFPIMTMFMVFDFNKLKISASGPAPKDRPATIGKNRICREEWFWRLPHFQGN
ncbi:hypothetical protein RZS08_46970, partial [Arthrospira platensis SPKY1]|nr:hypothetical protein [Arthrospira platensis SPKY1]